LNDYSFFSAPQLKRHPLGSMPVRYDDFEDSLRRKRALLRLILGIVWGVGVALTIKSGFVPGCWWDGRPWPYPLGHVLLAVAQVTLVSLCLYDQLRPQPEGSSIGRTGRAAAVALITLVWIEMNSWTDQPGYAYAAGGYVFIVTSILLLTLIVQVGIATVRALRRNRHAA